MSDSRSPALDSAEFRASLDAALGAPAWCVALSGGLDSSVLLHRLAAYRERHPGTPALRALHVNHGLHPDADAWARHCEALAAQLHVPLRTLTVAVEGSGQGLEAAARGARYEALGQQLGSGEILFTAHHLDDQVETLLLRLLRGAGLEGLGAIPPQRPLGRGSVLRPFLSIARAELAAYARAHALVPVEDPSNTDTALDRNYLRHRVLPLLEARWPGYRNTLGRAARHLREASAVLRESEPSLPTCQSFLGDPGLQLTPLLALADPLAARALRQWWQTLAPDAPPASAALEEFLRQLRLAGEGKAPRIDSGGVAVQRFRDAIYALPPAAAASRPATLTLGANDVVEIPGVGRLGLQPAVGPGLALAPGERLEIRWRQGGEQCRPRQRHACSLKQWLQEAGVPPWWRDRMPLVYCEQKLVAVVGLGFCEEAALADEDAWEVHWERNTSS